MTTNEYFRGVAQMVVRDIWDVEAASSSLATPTRKTALISRFWLSMRFTLYVLTELFIIIETILRFSGNLTLESFKCL